MIARVFPQALEDKGMTTKQYGCYNCRCFEGVVWYGDIVNVRCRNLRDGCSNEVKPNRGCGLRDPGERPKQETLF